MPEPIEAIADAIANLRIAGASETLPPRDSDEYKRMRAFFALSQATPDQERLALAKLRAA